MNNVTVDRWVWASHDEDDYGSDITTINFNIYKKGLFGKLKKVKGDYALMFNVDINNIIDIDTMAIHEFSSGIVPLNPHLAFGVMQASVISMEQAGEDKKADIMRETSKIFFKKKILNNG